MNTLKKISPKTLDIDLKGFVKNNTDGAVQKLYTIVGQVTGTKTGVSNYGEWLMFKGQFIVTKTDTGEVSTAPVAALPKFITEQLEPLVVQANGQPVEFAFEISVKRREDVAIGYEYLAKSLIEQRVSDPLLALMERAGVKVPQLAAPAETEAAPQEPANETATKSKKK